MFLTFSWPSSTHTRCIINNDLPQRRRRYRQLSLPVRLHHNVARRHRRLGRTARLRASPPPTTTPTPSTIPTATTPFMAVPVPAAGASGAGCKHEGPEAGHGGGGGGALAVGLRRAFADDLLKCVCTYGEGGVVLDGGPCVDG